VLISSYQSTLPSVATATFYATFGPGSEVSSLSMGWDAGAGVATGGGG